MAKQFIVQSESSQYVVTGQLDQFAIRNTARTFVKSCRWLHSPTEYDLVYEAVQHLHFDYLDVLKKNVPELKCATRQEVYDWCVQLLQAS